MQLGRTVLLDDIDEFRGRLADLGFTGGFGRLPEVTFLVVFGE
jgi:hypothetical protein